LSQLFAVLANAFTGNIGQLRTGLQIQFPQITASFANRGHGVVEHCKRERRRERCSKMVSPMLSPQPQQSTLLLPVQLCKFKVYTSRTWSLNVSISVLVLLAHRDRSTLRKSLPCRTSLIKYTTNDGVVMSDKLNHSKLINLEK
jgi:hypothetical protein